MSAVPNTTTFGLQDVVDVVVPTTNDLSDCFADAVAEYFDSDYAGSKNQLDDFRNYDNMYSFDWLGFLYPSFDTYDSTTIYFIVQNLSVDRDALSKQFYWEARLSGTPVDSGNFTAGPVDGGGVVYPTDAWANQIFDEIWCQVSGGSWVQIY